MEKLYASRFEARKRRAIDGRYWWCIWDTARGDWSTGYRLYGKYRTKHQAEVTIRVTVKLHYS